MPGILGNMLRNIWTVNLKLELLFSNFSVFQTKRRKAFAWGMDKRHDRCPSGFVGHWFQDSNRHQEPQTLKGKGKSLSRVRLLVTPWTAAYQAPPSVGFSRQEYWSGVPSPQAPCIKWQSQVDTPPLVPKGLCIQGYSEPQTGAPKRTDWAVSPSLDVHLTCAKMCYFQVQQTFTYHSVYKISNVKAMV